MNLSSLSSQLNISIQDLRNKAAEAGLHISHRANKIDNHLAKALIDKLSSNTVSTAPLPSKEVKIPAFIKVGELAVALNRPVTEIIKILVHNGIMATINEEIDHDTAVIIAQDLGVEVSAESDVAETLGVNTIQDILASEPSEAMVARPPIIAVMGHVDHGKTTLLDALRKTNVVSGESGGITQHIGAYQVIHKDKPITFLDTPGHEAFAEMRARGANVTDLIVLVVAADDGVRPQTVEVINRAKFTNTPILVAINKIDKETANPMKVKQELAGLGIVTEEWGGQTVAVEISAKENKGIDELLDMILLVTEVAELKANPHGKTVGTVIESHTESGKGPVASVVIQNGTLKIGDVVVAGCGYGRVKTLEDEHGKRQKQALPAMPIEVSGFSVAPQAGDILISLENIDEAKSIADRAVKLMRSHSLRAKRQLQGDASSKSLNLIIKADVAGSLEAIEQSLGKLKNDEVKINIASKGVGEINESDILLAESTKSHIVSFRSKTNPKALNLAKQKRVSIENYEIIYELIEDITTAVVKLFTPEYEHATFGKAEVLAIFLTEADFQIIGGKVLSGELRKSKSLALWRGETEVARGDILELQESKVSTKEVLQGREFGMKLKIKAKVKPGDILESFEEVLKQKSL
jgi:translation initiation factor IF-2